MQRTYQEPMWLEPMAVPPAEAARLAGLGRTKLYELIGTGELASCKVGNRRLILLEDLRTWLAGRRQTAISSPPAP